MPIYLMKCRDCETITEELFRTIGPLNVFFCPECGEITDKIPAPANSNFAAWSDTQNAAWKEALTPADPSDVIE